MKLRVAYAKRRYKDTIYATPLVVTSYRDEAGVSRNKTIVSLAKLPKYIVDLVEAGLKRGEVSALDECVGLCEIAYPGSVVVGPAFVVLTVLKQLGIYDAVMSSVPPQQAAALLHIVMERVLAAKPLSVMAQQRRFAQEPLAFLMGSRDAPSLNTWYAAISSRVSWPTALFGNCANGWRRFWPATRIPNAVKQAASRRSGVNYPASPWPNSKSTARPTSSSPA